MKSQVWIGKKRLKKPLIQGGMGIGVSLSGLAGAVAKEFLNETAFWVSHHE